MADNEKILQIPKQYFVSVDATDGKHYTKMKCLLQKDYDDFVPNND